VAGLWGKGKLGLACGEEWIWREMREDGTGSVWGAAVGDSELGKKKGEWRLFLALWFWERKPKKRGGSGFV